MGAVNGEALLASHAYVRAEEHERNPTTHLLQIRGRLFYTAWRLQEFAFGVGGPNSLIKQQKESLTS